MPVSGTLYWKVGAVVHALDSAAANAMEINLALIIGASENKKASANLAW